MSTKDVADGAVVRAALTTKRTGETTLLELMLATGQPRKVCLRAIERAVRRGFVDYGVSLETAFATKKGEALT